MMAPAGTSLSNDFAQTPLFKNKKITQVLKVPYVMLPKRAQASVQHALLLKALKNWL